MTIRLILLILITNFVFAKDSIETWGYLMKGEESYFPKRSSITDVAYFEMKIDVNGDLKGNLSTPTLPLELRKNTRSHIVITSSHHPDLYHHYLNNELPFRTNIINNIVKISKNFDGVQIDFEGINQRDGTNFLNFLCDLKQSLPKDKILSVAVMARWKNHKKLYPMDAYDYSIIGRIADRVIIMAYDEHYRTGSPGPIASLPWCQKIYEYALDTIPKNKIIMGIPFYGRAWQQLPKVSKYSDIEKLIKNSNLKTSLDTIDGGSFEINGIINIHYETLKSLISKRNFYFSNPIKGVAYWRISQEPKNFWELTNH